MKQLIFIVPGLFMLINESVYNVTIYITTLILNL